MFTLICEKCRREYPLSKGECPFCAAANEAVAAEAVAPSPPVEFGALPAAAPAAAPVAAPITPRPEPIARPQYVAPPSRQALPTWLMSIIFTLAFGGLLAGAYFVIEYFKKPDAAAAHVVALETPRAAGSAALSAGAHPYEKYLEVVGLRLTQDKSHKTVIRFLVVNHSGAEIPELAGSLSLIPRGGSASVGRVALKVASLGPYESKEVEAPVDTKLKVYELPDWQKLDAALELK